MEDLPGSLRDGLTDHLGAITTAQVQDGGFTPGLAARLQLASGQRLFAKGIPAVHPLAGWVVLVFDDIDGRYADACLASLPRPACRTSAPTRSAPQSRP